MGPNTRIA